MQYGILHKTQCKNDDLENPVLGGGGARVRGFKIVVSCVKMMLKYQILFESESQSSRPNQTMKKTLLRDVFR